MLGVDNPSYLDKMPFRYLNHYIVGRQDFNYTVEQIRPIFRLLYIFEKWTFSHSMCGIDCFICYNCADKMREKYPKCVILINKIAYFKIHRSITIIVIFLL
jgi:hypothetical protein